MTNDEIRIQIEQLADAVEGVTPRPETSVSPTTAQVPLTTPGTSAVNDFHLSDLGNAKRLVSRHGDDIHYCPQWGKPLVWQDGRWQVDNDGIVMRLAKGTVESIYLEAEARYQVADGATRADRKAIEVQREGLVRHALKSESDDALFSMLKLVETEAGIPVSADRLDSDPMLLNVSNGTIDLRTGKLRDHRKTDFLTKQSEVSYDPNATCPTWIQFLREITGGNEELMLYLQRAVGYSLTGDVSEQQFFFLYGIGANGKSTFVSIPERLLGPYFQKGPRSLIESRSGGEGIPCDIARLQGTRLVVCNETDEGKRLAEATIKDLTGGDRLVARYLRHEFFEFNPTHKLWVYGNHRLVISGTDHGIWRRIHFIPFTVTIAEDKRDPHLKDKLLLELPGILNWAVAGCLEWQKSGLRPPAAVVDAVSEYRQEMDVLGQFLEMRCRIVEGAWVESGPLFQAFQDWQAAEGVKTFYQVGQKAFCNKLRGRGLLPYKRQGCRGWTGIELLDGSDTSEGDSPIEPIELISARDKPETTLCTVRSVHDVQTSIIPRTVLESEDTAVNDLEWNGRTS